MFIVLFRKYLQDMLSSRYGQIPVSQIVRADNDGKEPQKKSREDFKKDRELEEARKLGTVPALVDEDGKDINPHIPHYISRVPWYYGSVNPTLKHQRMPDGMKKVYSKMDEWYKRGADTTGSSSSKYRRGACENCGAMTHKRKDCLERPRRVGARFTGAEIAPDEQQQPSISLDFDGKRDRWNGYDPASYSQVIDEHRKVEEAKRELKASRLKEASSSGGDQGAGAGAEDDRDSGSEDDERYAEGVDMPGTKVDSKQRITVRNLRIREDTAKYLRNLALDSAFYDPKTRSMRENPYENKADTDYRGENFVRYTGDTAKQACTQLFAWEAQKRGVDVHEISDPTRLELLQRQYEKNRDQLEGSTKTSLLERYGGREHLDAPPRQLLLAQTENYVEYSRQGKVIKGAEADIIRSSYEEDVFVNNHTSVWGSYWWDGVWGYKCCHGTVRNSYCTGEAGREAAAADPVVGLASASTADGEPSEMSGQRSSGDSEEEQSSRDQEQQEYEERQARKRERKRKKAEKRKNKKRKRVDTQDPEEDEEEVRRKKVAQAMIEQRAQEAQASRLVAMDERKRPYNSMVDVHEPTAEEMEAWRMRQSRADDPMAHFSTQC